MTCIYCSGSRQLDCVDLDGVKTGSKMVCPYCKETEETAPVDKHDILMSSNYEIAYAWKERIGNDGLAKMAKLIETNMTLGRSYSDTVTDILALLPHGPVYMGVDWAAGEDLPAHSGDRDGSRPVRA